MTIENKKLAPVAAEDIRLPETACSAVCGDCRYMSQSDSNKWGEYWCGKRGHYYEAGSSACSDYSER